MDPAQGQKPLVPSDNPTPPPLGSIGLATPVSDLGDPLREFLKISGGTLAYCLSTASILYGLAQIIGPTLARSFAWADRLPCIGVLNVYELCLIGVLLLIVRCWRVFDDAVSLVVLVAVLLTANAIASDTVVNENPRASLLVGIGGFGLALLKVGLVDRQAGVHLPRLLSGGTMLLLAWSYLACAGLSHLLKNRMAGLELMRHAWQIGWLAMLAAGGLMLVHAARAPRAGGADSGPRPFFLSPAMGWVFALLLFFAANVHQYALAYIYDLDAQLADFLPVIGLSALLLLEILRTAGPALFIAALPLIPILGVCLTGSFSAGPAASVALLWYPPVLLALMAAALAWAWRRHGQLPLLALAAAYGLSAVLTAGIAPGETPSLNWRAAGALLAAALALAGVLRQKPHLVLGALAIVVIWLSGIDPVRYALVWFGWDRPMAVLLLFGMATQAVYLLYGSRLHRLVAFCGAALIAVCAWPIPLDAGWGRLAIFSVVAGGAGLLVWFRIRDPFTSVVLAVPIARLGYLVAARTAGWRYVILSFILLGVGFLMSRSKARTGTAAEPSGDAPRPNAALRATGSSIWSYIIIGVAALFILSFAGSVPLSHEKARRVSCLNNLKQIGLAAHIYSSDHGERFPATLTELQPSYLAEDDLFICPSAPDGERGKTPPVSYIYVGGLTESDPADCAMAMDVPGNHGDAGGNVLYVGGYVKWVDNATLRRLVQEPWADSSGVKDAADLRSRARIVMPPSPPQQRP